MLSKHQQAFSEVAYFLNCTRSFFSNTPPLHDATNPMLPSFNDVLQIKSITVFSPFTALIIKTKQFRFPSSDQGTANVSLFIYFFLPFQTYCLCESLSGPDAFHSFTNSVVVNLLVPGSSIVSCSSTIQCPCGFKILSHYHYNSNTATYFSYPGPPDRALP